MISHEMRNFILSGIMTKVIQVPLFPRRSKKEKKVGKGLLSPPFAHAYLPARALSRHPIPLHFSVVVFVSLHD